MCTFVFAGKPEPPTGKPTASNISRDTLTVSWSGAAYDGGSRITGYVLEMCTTQDQTWNRVIRTSSTSHVLRDLEPDVEYLFRVSAENTHGSSEPSEISDAILTADDDDDVFSDGKHQDSDGKIYIFTNMCLRKYPKSSMEQCVLCA